MILTPIVRQSASVTKQKRKINLAWLGAAPAFVAQIIKSAVSLDVSLEPLNGKENPSIRFEFPFPTF